MREKRDVRVYKDGGARSDMQQCVSVQQCMQRGKGEKQAQASHESKSVAGTHKNAGNARNSTSKNLNVRKRQ